MRYFHFFDLLVNVLFRAQLFVNAYIVNNKDSIDLAVITQQNFWYAISQLIMGQKITNKAYISNSVALGFEDFKAVHPSIVFFLKYNPIKSYSDALSAACVVLATAYLNHIVENFQRRVLYYLTVRLAIIYPDKPKGLLYKLADDFCWELLIIEESKWPTKYFDLVTIQHIAQILPICNGLQARLPILSTVKNLAASPTKFVPALATIISDLEKLCDEHEDDNSKMPRRFSLMPTSSMRWRYISINTKALQAITKHKSDGTYKGNVSLFYSIFNFKKFGYESLDKVLKSQNKFTCCIQTDGFGECFTFPRKAKEEKATIQLGLEDFSDQEIQEPSAEENERVACKNKFQYSNSIPLVVFGDGMKNKDTIAIRDHVSGVMGTLQKELLQRSRQFKDVLVGINEFRASKVCNNCKQKRLEQKKSREAHAF
ncbi:hypothetical protein CU097_005445 [Rhizopus azygosporus]|uniref:Uncharacterized protein n=1 Tax=Rhizopus azygosporus TaxID=86630 RepID=A0A367J409_RHIAZ|nr:hypothetical protein CU097_005445 [Rhizopus azygosporus]